MKIFRFTVVSLIFVFSALLAQESGADVPQNIQQEIKKQGMTVEQAKSEAQMLGIDLSNPDQAAQRARELGVPESKIQELLDGINQTQAQAPDLYEGEIQTDQTESNIDPVTENQTDESVSTEESDLENQDESTEEEEILEQEGGAGRGPRPLPYYGYELFETIPAAFQPTETGPVDDGYLIGPGDQLRLIVWGATEFQYELTVNRDGSIYVPNVGQYVIANKTLENCRRDMKNWLSRKYQGLVTDPPTIFMDISITKLRPIRVFVLGEVARPGGYTISSYSTIFNVLYSVGGPLTRGSLRNIKLIRNGKVVDTFDFYNYLLKGYEDTSVRLQNNDHIFIPLREKTVTISGMVNRPAVYELTEKESVKKLIEYAGGLKAEAYTKRFQIERIIPYNERKDPSIARMLIDEELDVVLQGKKSVKIADGDKVKVFSILDILENSVEITGAVYQPGTYELNLNLVNVADLIEKADGISGDAYLKKADLYRINPDMTERLITIDLEKVAQDNELHNIVLFPYDRLRIYSIHELEQGNTVSIIGKVRRPGNYGLVDSMTVYDLLFLGNGLNDPEFLNEVYLERADLVREDSLTLTKHILEFNLYESLRGNGLANELLQPNDQIIIYPKDIEFTQDRNVSITGKLLNPGIRPWRSNLKVKDVLITARGLYDKEFLKDVLLVRADIIRTNEDGISKRIIQFNLGQALQGEGFADSLLYPYDEIKIYSVDVREFRNKFISVNGKVKNPGQYPWRTNMNLLDAILTAGGFTEDAYIKSIEVARPVIKYDNFQYSEKYDKILIDLPELISPEDLKDIEKISVASLNKMTGFQLKSRDIIYIRKNPNFRTNESVFIEGEVMFPGSYALLYEGELLSELIQRAGGLTDRAYPKAGRFYRLDNRMVADLDLAAIGKSKYDIQLLPGDRILIPPKPNVVSVQGNVQISGFIKYESGKRAMDYVNMAGGTKDETDKVLVTYPTGKTKQIKKFMGIRVSNPKVDDGTQIVVTIKPPKEEKEQVDIKRIVTESMAILSSALTIIILAQNL